MVSEATAASTVLEKWAKPASFSFIFGLFKQTIQFLTTYQCEKCHAHPVYGDGIRTS